VTLPARRWAPRRIEETRIVDNRKYKYLVVAELEDGVAAKNARITAIQVVLGK
jgi:hypothetical protein